MSQPMAMELSLADVAALCRVQRPVVSMWRSRSAGTVPPFPEPVSWVRGEERFDVDAVVDWLASTGRGNNSSVRADAAGFARPRGLRIRDDLFHEGITALLCLGVISGESLAGQSAGQLLDLADDADPDDEFLRREVEALDDQLEACAGYADALADAAYNPAEAFERLVGRTRGSEDVLDEAAVHLVASVAGGLSASLGLEPPIYADPTPGGSVALLLAMARGSQRTVDPTIKLAAYDRPEARLACRRLRVHDLHREPFDVDDDGRFDLGGPAVVVAQYASGHRPGLPPEVALNSVEQVALQMDDHQRAVVLGPADVLTDPLRAPSAESIRDDLLRGGRLRAVVRLPKGLLKSRSRQSLALWVLGPSHPDVGLDERWTVTADLANVTLSAAVIEDLVSDIVAAMGARAAVRGHAFRFGSVVLTRALVTGSGSLVGRRVATSPSVRVRGAEAAVRITELKDALSAAEPVRALATVDVRSGADQGNQTGATVTLGALAEARKVLLLPGNRLDGADLAGHGVRVIGPPELTGAVPIGSRRIDRLLLADRYDAVRHTEPGDVVFCTSPRPAALVDADGGSIVAYPARVLRVPSGTAGILPRVVAAAINRLPAYVKEWRLCEVPVVPRVQAARLDQVLVELARERAAQLTRLEQIDELSELVTQAVTTGAITLAADDHHPKGT